MTNPLLIEIPETLTTDRLGLRLPLPPDSTRLHEAVRASLPEVGAWMPWVYGGYNDADSLLFIRRTLAAFHQRTEWSYLIERQIDQALVGTIGLHHIDWAVPAFEIGYWARTSMTGQGYITEAVRAITRMAFIVLQARRVEIRCDEDNTASAAVAERAGFTLEGRLRHDALKVDGSPRNTLIYGLIRADFDA